MCLRFYARADFPSLVKSNNKTPVKGGRPVYILIPRPHFRNIHSPILFLIFRIFPILPQVFLLVFSLISICCQQAPQFRFLGRLHNISFLSLNNLAKTPCLQPFRASSFCRFFIFVVPPKIQRRNSHFSLVISPPLFLSRHFPSRIFHFSSSHFVDFVL